MSSKWVKNDKKKWQKSPKIEIQSRKTESDRVAWVNHFGTRPDLSQSVAHLSNKILAQN